jgi:hypothetical protein
MQKEQFFSYSWRNTPGRDFILTANTREDMDQWICAFQKVQNTDPTSQDLRRKIRYIV